MSQVLTKIGGYNAYVYTPSNYDGKTKMPCLIAVPGNGEVGQAATDAAGMLKYLPCKFIAAGYNPSMIVICIQPPAQWPQVQWLKAMYDLIIGSYAVDLGRVYGSGYSAGGTVWDAFVIQYPTLIAALFSLSSPPINNGPSDAPLYQQWATDGGHLWALNGANDNSNGFGLAV
jgi:poly(3-hydroxybutyrate) depolymerase